MFTIQEKSLPYRALGYGIPGVHGLFYRGGLDYRLSMGDDLSGDEGLMELFRMNLEKISHCVRECMRDKRGEDPSPFKQYILIGRYKHV